jgi:hypothetical protein
VNTPIHEHQKIKSRTNGQEYEIMFGPQPGNLVPANPFASKLQSRFAHANPDKFGGKKGLEHWDKVTNYSSLPEKKEG